MRNYILTFFILLILGSCNYPYWDLVDPVDNGSDTTIVDPEPVIVPDTCEELISYSDSAFTILSLHFFNGSPMMHEWHKKDSPLVFADLVSLMLFFYPQYEYTYYEENNSISLFVDGVYNNDLFEGKIWTYDAVGQRAQLTPDGQTMLTYGALTYEESMYEASHRYNVRVFHFFNTDWTPEQYNTYSREVMHFKDCKRGEDKANFRDADGIAQTVIDSAILYKWIKVWF